MRRAWILLLLAALVLVAMAAPATAAKGGKPGPPAAKGLGVTVDLVDVTYGAWMFSVVAPGDQVVFRVQVTNEGQAPAENVEVTDDWGIDFACAIVDDKGTWTPDAEACDDALEPGATYYYQGIFTADAANLPQSAGEIVTNRDTVRATATGASGSASVDLSGYYAPLCDAGNLAEPDPTATGKLEPGLATFPGMACRWVPSELGFYRIVVEANWDLINGAANGSVSVRDHVGGNWCAVPAVQDPQEEGIELIESTGVKLFRRLRPGDPPLELLVYLPVNGVCLSGGAGGDLLGVGSTTDFYFVPGPPGSVVSVKRCDPNVEGSWCSGLPDVVWPYP